MNRLLIIRFSSLGDIILTEPVVRTLRAAYPQAELHFLTKLRHERILSLFPGLNRIHAYSPDRRALLLKQLQALKFDAVIDLHNNIRSRVISQAVEVPTYRTSKQWLQRVATVKLKSLKVQPAHCIDRYAAALAPLELALNSRAPQLVALPESEQWWGSRRERVTGTKPYYVIAGGAAHPTKQAPVELWKRIHSRLVSAGYTTPVLVGSSAEKEFLAEVSEALGAGVLVIEKDITRAAAVLQAAQFVISNDSGIAHLAAALGTPVLALFGPTHPILGFAPLGEYADCYTTNEYCSPCSLHGKRPCHREERHCFKSMNENVILERLEVLLSKKLSASGRQNR